MIRPPSRPGRDDAQSILQEMEHLRVQLSAANSRADQAERAAEELERHLSSRPTPNEATTSSDDSAGAIASLQAENQGLRAELDDARSHIFSLQPYRKELTPEEVGREFDDLVNGIADWVTKLMDPILDDDDKMDEIVSAAKKRPLETQKLKKYMHSYGDLVHGSMFPETDIDILLAIIMRFLQEHVFQKVLFDTVPSVVDVLALVESSMQTNVEPKRDLFALRTWQAEGLNAVICSHDYQRARSARTRELTLELAAMFKPLRKDRDKTDFCHSCQQRVILPAVALHERLVTSTHHFYLDLNPYVVWNARRELEMSPDFLDHLPALRCENILQNRRPLHLARLDPPPTREQLCRGLTAVVSTVPALYMRQVGKGDVIRPPTAVRMQQVLVAWDPQARPERRWFADAQPTLMHRIYHAQAGGRLEREGAGGSGGQWAQWRGMPWA
ncbi:hypothetical protein BT67DRAFT_448710 [Trichocladium antarcticum]|uniref:Uncharacterized protein n=1 Tax=Trichocladium antarcticum TaxID=1450529 RepID=A0AAN6UMT2_9PEZI|nr:hypothetical protein BT67DRAFT_448710 [Trichocladium antarcticum]